MPEEAAGRPGVSALSDPRVKWLRCRVCERRFRNTPDAAERIVDHMETEHPAEVYTFWQEFVLLLKQAERELAGMEA